MWSAMVNAGMRNPLQAGEGDSCWYVDHTGSLCSRKNWGVCLCGMMLMMHVMNNDEYDMSSPQMPIVPRLQRHQRRHPTLCQSIVIHHQLKLWSSTGIDLRWARWCFCSFYWIWSPQNKELLCCSWFFWFMSQSKIIPKYDPGGVSKILRSCRNFCKVNG